jgi:hypothetical protein
MNKKGLILIEGIMHYFMVAKIILHVLLQSVVILLLFFVFVPYIFVRFDNHCLIYTNNHFSFSIKLSNSNLAVRTFVWL